MLRPADPALDAAACAAIYAPHVREGAESFEEVAPSADEMARRIVRLTATHAWLVFERDGEVAGYAYACPHRERAAYRWAADVSVYVDPAHRRTGIARALYVALFERLREQDIRVATAGITLPNDASVALHESLGFEPVGVFRGIGWKHGAWRDVGWWQLELGRTEKMP
jgi:L-amino acid N-acyltransferase YncA